MYIYIYIYIRLYVYLYVCIYDIFISNTVIRYLVLHERHPL